MKRGHTGSGDALTEKPSRPGRKRELIRPLAVTARPSFICFYFYHVNDPITIQASVCPPQLTHTCKAPRFVHTLLPVSIVLWY